MKKLFDIFKPWSWTLARHAFWNMLTFIGCIALIAYFASLHFYLILPTILFLAIIFTMLYKFEQGFRARRMEKGLY